MKKSILIFTAALFLTGLCVALLQSNFAKRIAQDYISEALEESGFTIDIGSIEGTIPHAIHLKKVAVRSNALDIFVDSIETRLSLFGLLKKEIIFTEIQAQGISWQAKESAAPPVGVSSGVGIALEIDHFSLKDVNIPGYFSTNFEGALKIGKRNKKLYLDVTATTPESPTSKSRITAQIDKTGLLRGKGSLNTSALAKPPFNLPFDGKTHLQLFARGPWKGTIHGKIFGSITPTIESLPPNLTDFEFNQPWKGSARFQWLENGTWTLSRLSVSAKEASITGSGQGGADGKLSQANIQIQSKKINALLKINAIERESYRFKIHGSDWHGVADMSWTPQLQIENADFQYRSTRLNGHLTFKPVWNGQVNVSIGNLNELLHDGIYGSLQLTSNWLSTENGTQGVHLEGSGAGIYWNDLFCEQLKYTSDLTNPFQYPQGTLQINAGKIKWQQLFLESLTLETNSLGNQWPFEISTGGQWKHPLALNLMGTWNYGQGKFQCSVQNGSGSFYNHPLRFSTPAAFEYASDHLQLSDFNISLGDAEMHLKMEHTQENQIIDIALVRFPLDVLSLNPLDVNILGKTDCTLNLKGSGSDLSGTLNAAITGMSASSPGEEVPKPVKGNFTAKFQKQRLTLEGGLDTEGSQLLQTDLSVPVALTIWPPKAELIYDKKVQGRLFIHGRIEEILDFFDLGMHRIEGNCLFDCRVSNTLLHPVAEGSFHLDHGFYENYITGMQLVDIEAKGNAKGDRFRIEIKALDRHRKGDVTASGFIDLRPAQNFPFQFNAAFNHLEAVQIDLVTAEAQGQIQIEGNLNEAVAKGKIEVIQSDFHVPSHLPRSLPNLVVVYKNPNFPTKPIELSETKTYPLLLNLDVNAPERIFIEGRGLDSEWKGNFHLGGDYTAMTAQGKLELIKGQFVFSGRSFKLIDGSLTFRGHEQEMPYINLAAAMQIKEVVITARLKGPLNNPQITLQSVPPLPMGTIMAYILFGQDLSEINSFQALQLANSLASIAGEGPDVMETTRKTLGVDRLQIVSVPGDDEALAETLAVQVGKYVSEGILVSFTQGAEDASGNISIEIEMKHGLILQLESDQRQEQGKFTLKWNHNF